MAKNSKFNKISFLGVILSGCFSEPQITKPDTDQNQRNFQMEPEEIDLKVPKPELRRPDIILEVQEDRYLLDGKEVRKSDLYEEIKKVASEGKKVLEIRTDESIDFDRIYYALDVPMETTGLDVVQMDIQSGIVVLEKGGDPGTGRAEEKLGPGRDGPK